MTGNGFFIISLLIQKGYCSKFIALCLIRNLNNLWIICCDVTGGVSEECTGETDCSSKKAVSKTSPCTAGRYPLSSKGLFCVYIIM